MQKVIDGLQNFFVKNDTWIFFSVILAFSYVFMQTNQNLGWKEFLGWISSFTILSIGTLIFSSERRNLRAKKSAIVYWSLWFTSVACVPILIFFLAQISNIFEDMDRLLNYGLVKNLDIIVAILVISFSLLEVMLFFSEKTKKNEFRVRWVQYFTLPRLFFISIAIFAFLLTMASNAFQASTANADNFTYVGLYISCTFQLFLIFGSYYLFYHINHHFLFNKILRKKGIIAYVASLVGLLLALTPLLNMIINQFPVIDRLQMHTLYHSESIFSDINYLFPILTLIGSFPLIIFIEFNKKEKDITALRKEKSEAELNLLKQQINPHFFFNTLNNLYAMSLDKSDQTPEMILKLSELMRFVIYKGKQENVLLTDEVKYIEDYIDLQKLRLHKKVDISFNKEGDLSAIEVPPLLFINLIENAFKHGIEPAENASYLNIDLEVSYNQLIFRCENSFEQDIHSAESKGIGIENLRKRLHILYPDEHHLTLEQKDETFIAVLSIDL